MADNYEILWHEFLIATYIAAKRTRDLDTKEMALELGGALTIAESTMRNVDVKSLTNAYISEAELRMEQEAYNDISFEIAEWTAVPQDRIVAPGSKILEGHVVGMTIGITDGGHMRITMEVESDEDGSRFLVQRVYGSNTVKGDYVTVTGEPTLIIMLLFSVFGISELTDIVGKEICVACNVNSAGDKCVYAIGNPVTDRWMPMTFSDENECVEGVDGPKENA